jgi:hypothetical protein
MTFLMRNLSACILPGEAKDVATTYFRDMVMRWTTRHVHMDLSIDDPGTFLNFSEGLHVVNQLLRKGSFLHELFSKVPITESPRDVDLQSPLKVDGEQYVDAASKKRAFVENNESTEGRSTRRKARMDAAAHSLSPSAGDNTFGVPAGIEIAPVDIMNLRCIAKR